MQRHIKYLVGRIYKPLLVKYLSKTRSFRYRDLTLQVPKEVFHPGFFFSSKMLLRYLASKPLGGRTLLELGAGSGLISFVAARSGALVTATDINPRAIDFLHINARTNGLAPIIIESDLFKKIPRQPFDVIAINPPYYRKTPATAADYAWCCGENGEYFQGLFANLANYTTSATQVYIILCDGCDMDMIHGIAAAYGWKLHCVEQRANLLETNFIFRATSG